MTTDDGDGDMSGGLVPMDGDKLPTKFEPEAVKRSQARTKAIIDYAKTVQDWPLLERAIDVKIEEQEEFVRWWKETVRRKGGADGYK